MRILAFTDTHNSSTAIKKLEEKIKKHEPDIILCCGDFTVFMHDVEATLKKINSFKKKTFLIHGNHEDEDDIAKLCDKLENIEFIHKKAVQHENLLILGFGGGGFSHKDRNFETIEKKFEQAIHKAGNSIKILILHQPPYKSEIDYVFGTYAGCKTTKNFIDKHKIEFVFAGHLHENSDRENKTKHTIFINPGPYGRIIEFGN